MALTWSLLAWISQTIIDENLTWEGWTGGCWMADGGWLFYTFTLWRVSRATCGLKWPQGYRKTTQGHVTWVQCVLARGWNGCLTHGVNMRGHRPGRGKVKWWAPVTWLFVSAQRAIRGWHPSHCSLKFIARWLRVLSVLVSKLYSFSESATSYFYFWRVLKCVT